jgi:hypothetical protein
VSEQIEATDSGIYGGLIDDYYCTYYRLQILDYSPLLAMVLLWYYVLLF